MPLLGPRGKPEPIHRVGAERPLRAVPVTQGAGLASEGAARSFIP